MGSLVYVGGILALLVCGTGWRFVHQLKRKRMFSSLLWGVQGVLVLLVFILVLLVYSNLQTYRYLNYQVPVADVYLRQLGPDKFQLSLSSSEQDEDQHYFVLHGDQWQLDVKILKWTGWANLLGLDSYYRLDRVSGSYSTGVERRHSDTNAFDLSSAPVRGLDLWRLKKRLKSTMDYLDALNGWGLMPMKDGAHFRVSIGQHGLLVVPVNAVARTTVF